MKFSAFGLLAVLLLAMGSSAIADHRHHSRGHYGYGYSYGYWPYHGYPYYYNYYPAVGVDWDCAPEVVENNLQSADRVLGQLATGELKNESTFRARVSAVAAIESNQEKTEAYMKLAGIDSADPEKVLNFLYAREVSPESVQTVQKNLRLNPEQAKLVINKMIDALKPLK